MAEDSPTGKTFEARRPLAVGEQTVSTTSTIQSAERHHNVAAIALRYCESSAAFIAPSLGFDLIDRLAGTTDRTLCHSRALSAATR